MFGHSPILPEAKVITEKDFDFPEAIRRMTDGAKVTKREWKNPDVYGMVKDGILMLHKADGKFYKWLISDGDLGGLDYTIA